MQSSPRGRTIEYVEGSPDGIIERGNAITTLGDQMLNSAEVLENIKTRAIDDGSQKGQAIEALRDAVGDSYETLRKAGELYQPVGPVIAAYGQALESVQPLIRSAVDDSQGLWQTYVSLPGEVEARGAGGFMQPDAGSPEAEQQAEEDAAKRAAYDAWEERAQDFDVHYDTWEDAFDTAVENIGDEMADSIKDSFWDALDDFSDMLSKAAMIAGIAALILGGPFTAIAFALSAAVLAVAAVQMFDGNKSWGERFFNLGMGVVGVLPFGRFGKVLDGQMSFTQATLKPLTSVGDEVASIRTIMSDDAVNLGRAIFRNGNPNGVADLFTRVTLGNSASDLSGIADDMGRMSVGGQLATAHIDVLGSQLKALADYGGWAGAY